MSIFLIMVIVLVLWIILGVIGFCLDAKGSGYKEASPSLAEDLLMYCIMGAFGFLLGIVAYIEKKRVMLKITQILLKLINRKSSWKEKKNER